MNQPADVPYGERFHLCPKCCRQWNWETCNHFCIGHDSDCPACSGQKDRTADYPTWSYRDAFLDWAVKMREENKKNGDKVPV